ncbi:transposase family protein [Actinomadura alba]|uniref:Transposase family protein n=1 Tax=Actinomadura alba TaxID=406431 RepID=A0ABR7LZB2_9ACTN|nr:transposase family protein [Actinomadura alba]MBC6470096.1 transposase family protein [Actinomadura alba]
MFELEEDDGGSGIRVQYPRKSFTEQIEQIPAGARITTRLRGAAGRRVRDAASTVIQAARDLHLSWPTVMDAFRTAAREVTEAPLPEVQVLGIDETRRGRPRWEQDPATGKWHLVRDRWHTGFVDAFGTGGLLGKVEGRTTADVLAWLATTQLTWRKSIRVRGHRHVNHLPRRHPHPSTARHRRGRPLPRRPARQQDAVRGPPPRPAAGADAPVTRNG